VDESRLTRQRRTLGALQKVRDLEVEGSSRALAGAIEALGGASQAVARAEEAVVAHARAQTASRANHRTALEGGSARAGELADDAAWEQGSRAQHDALAARATAARRVEAEAAERAEKARANLAEGRAAAKVSEAALSRLDAEQRRAAELREEEAAAEAWRPRR
jgi:hypothetical protein